MDTLQENELQVIPEESYPSQICSLRIRVKNDNHQHSYVTLLDEGFNKSLVLIDIPIMDDPTIGRLEKYVDFCRSFKGKKMTVGSVSIWCPALMQHLDLFTLHIYEITPSKDNPHAFSNLVILPSRADPYQLRTDIICSTERKFTLVQSSRIALIVPAHSTMLIDLYLDQIEDAAVPELPI